MWWRPCSAIMSSAQILRLVLMVLLHNAGLSYIHDDILASTVYDYAKAISLTYSMKSESGSDDPCKPDDYFYHNNSTYEHEKHLQEQIKYQNAHEAFQASQGLVPYPHGRRLHETKHRKRTPKYFRLAPRSPIPPVLQKTFLVKQPQSFSTYLVNAHDFNKDFHDVIYVADSVSMNSPDYKDYDIQVCSPCNSHFNRTYWSYSDFDGRYVSCDLTFKFPDEKYPLKELSYGVCKNDKLYEKICNPCQRERKLVRVPIVDNNNPRLHLRLPFEEIVQLGVPFWDKYNNVYEFFSLTEYNVEFDDTYGDPFPPYYDYSQVYKYYYIKEKKYE